MNQDLGVGFGHGRVRQHMVNRIVRCRIGRAHSPSLLQTNDVYLDLVVVLMLVLGLGVGV